MNWKNLLMVPSLLLSFVLTLIASPLPRPCNIKIHPKRALQRIIDKNYKIMDDALVKAPATIQEILGIPLLRKPRDVTATMHGASPCQWQMGTTKIRPSEVPMSFAQAHCPSCVFKHFCSPIKYTVKVLVKDECDPKIGLAIWRWKERQITVGYVYTGKR